MSGWRKLGKTYGEDKSDTEKFSAEQHDVLRLKQGCYFRGVSGAMGLAFIAVSHGTCLHVIVGEAALGLRIALLFRPSSPSLYIPWKDIRQVTYQNYFIFSTTRIHVQGYRRRITLYGRAGQRVFEQFNAAKQTRTKANYLAFIFVIKHCSEG